jgi:ankyrin repeat protein
VDIDARGPDGATALIWASHRGDGELVAALLSRGSDPDAANDYGVTPLAAAAVEADPVIIRALLEAGADVESATPEGQTVLMVVARTGRVDAARLLLEHGARVNAHESFGGQTALMWAAAQKHPMVRLFSRRAPDADARGRRTTGSAALPPSRASDHADGRLHAAALRAAKLQRVRRAARRGRRRRRLGSHGERRSCSRSTTGSSIRPSR